MSRALLEVRDLHKSFHKGGSELHILRGLELELASGTMLAVTGMSGCGKSTLLHLLGAMEQPDRGSIRFADEEIQNLGSADRAAFRNREIGFVFQFHHLLPEFNAAENVMMPLLLAREPFQASYSRACKLLELVGLLERKDHRPGELSGGEQQRVALARALINRPRLLLADEPTGNLDEATSGQIQDLLLQIHREQNVTSIIVTHDTSFAAACERHCKLQNGELREAAGEALPQADEAPSL